MPHILLMIWLILTILSVTGIFIVFKVIDNTKTPLINSIFINCLIASPIGISIEKIFSTFKRYSEARVWIYGVMLGIVDFRSIYFMIRILNSGIFLNSIVYGIINICVVLLSVLTGTKRKIV